MARSITSRDRDSFRAPALHASAASHHDVRPDDLLGDDELRAEMSRLMAANQELLTGAGSSPIGDDHEEELRKLRAENAELHACLDEMEHAWQERQREYESLLEEKSEVIRGLHLKLQEAKEPPAARAADPSAIEEVARMKRELEEDRRQLQEDEEALMQQMREMELAMSRERAEMARQRNEMQRLQAELNHEVEHSSRDSGLRERLQALQRHPHEPPAQAARPPSVSQPTPPPKGGSGLFRRMFGGS